MWAKKKVTDQELDAFSNDVLKKDITYLNQKYGEQFKCKITPADYASLVNQHIRPIPNKSSMQLFYYVAVILKDKKKVSFLLSVNSMPQALEESITQLLKGIYSPHFNILSTIAARAAFTGCSERTVAKFIKWVLENLRLNEITLIDLINNMRLTETQKRKCADVFLKKYHCALFFSCSFGKKHQVMLDILLSWNNAPEIITGEQDNILVILLKEMEKVQSEDTIKKYALFLNTIISKCNINKIPLSIKSSLLSSILIYRPDEQQLDIFNTLINSISRNEFLAISNELSLAGDVLYEGSLLHLLVQLAKEHNRLTYLDALLGKISDDIGLSKKIIADSLNYLNLNLIYLYCPFGILPRLGFPNNSSKQNNQLALVIDDKKALFSFLKKGTTYRLAKKELEDKGVVFKLGYVSDRDRIKLKAICYSLYPEYFYAASKNSRKAITQQITDYLNEYDARITPLIPYIEKAEDAIKEYYKNNNQENILTNLSVFLDKQPPYQSPYKQVMLHTIFSELEKLLSNVNDLTLKSFAEFEASVKNFYPEKVLTSFYVAKKIEWLIANNEWDALTTALDEIVEVDENIKKMFVFLKKSISIKLPYSTLNAIKKIMNKDLFINENLDIEETLELPIRFYAYFYSYLYAECESVILSFNLSDDELEEIKQVYPYDMLSKISTPFEPKPINFSILQPTLKDTLTRWLNVLIKLNVVIKTSSETNRQIKAWHIFNVSGYFDFIMDVSNFILNSESFIDKTNSSENIIQAGITTDEAAEMGNTLIQKFKVLQIYDVFDDAKKEKIGQQLKRLQQWKDLFDKKMADKISLINSGVRFMPPNGKQQLNRPDPNSADFGININSPNKKKSTSDAVQKVEDRYFGL